MSSHTVPTAVEGVRLQRWLADAGLCSRREGETWIQAGRVSVNGVTVVQMGTRVTTSDQVAVDGLPIHKRWQPRRIILLHKPREVICTRRDPEGRRTIFDLLTGPVVPSRLVSVGRLDYASEGVLLLSNDGELANRLMHPKQQLARVYRARIHGHLDSELLRRLQQEGVHLDDGTTGPLQISIDQITGSNSWVTVTLHEGRNRLVRRIFESLDRPVSRLIRTSYGSIKLGELPSGAWRFLAQDEIDHLRKLAGFNWRPVTQR
ncbi:MAG: rRNA pseudouridine synthase [Magnetococcales bacterium]|nr:rRNA pseudouridine synthase [Magnetococcales bacterium]